MDIRELIKIIWLSVWVSVLAVMLAGAVGLPLGYLIGARRFRGRMILVRVLNTLMALPTVVVGLVMYMLLSRRGLLGPAGLLYTPWAIMLGEFVLILPIITFMSLATVESLDRRIRETALTLGADRRQTIGVIALEARFGLIAALIAGFGRAVGEVGVAMMLGGNIRGFTRTMTTFIALETSKGEFMQGIILGLVLLGVSFLVIFLLGFLQGHGREVGPQ